MKTKYTSAVLFLVMILILSAGFFVVHKVSAQSSPFPDGCSSALGYSVTTGKPCNGTDTATASPMPGCSTALGYSVTNGKPCSGSSVALSYLAGCTSTYGYSTITGAPCNGTTVATNGFVALSTNTYTAPTTYTSPGLPTTGAGGEAPMNILFMVVSLTIAVLGSTYLVSKERP